MNTFKRQSGRRAFLKMTALGSLAGASVALGDTQKTMRQASAQELKEKYPQSKKVKTICTHCSVGCGIVAEVVDGVWVRQEVAQDHPISQGGHCCKGADLIDRARSETRLRYPVEKQNGKWQRVSWDSAMGKIADKLSKIREEHGPDAVMFIGSAKCSNEQSYYIRKFTAFFGTNNLDHCNRVCHSPTVAGVANTFGYGGMTNHLGDMMFSKYILIIGANPAVNHPVSMVHILRSKEKGCKLVCVDPRFTKTAAKCDEFHRIRSGTDIAFAYGMLNHIIAKKLYDEQYLRDRVDDYEAIMEEAKKFPPEVVADITGVPADTIRHIAEEMAAAKPACLIWNQGLTQHTVGTSNTRIMPILQMFLGNIGKNGGGVNILRGHDNVQGSSDMSANPDILPGYYPLTEKNWRYFARHWKVDYDWLKGRFKNQQMMEKTGYAISTWKFGAIDSENAANNGDTMIKALVVIGTGMTTASLLHLHQQALNQMELIVFIDPYVNDFAVYTDKPDGVFCLPAASQMETSGSLAATNRSYQWRSKVMEPFFECRPDEEILFDFANRLGFLKEYQQSLYDIAKSKGRDQFIWPDDATTEYTQSIRTIGLQGMNPERLKAHQENWHLFDKVTLEGTGAFAGEYYGLPWPCWSDKHPGTPVLYNDEIPVMRGGMGFRTNWGTTSQATGKSMLSPHSLPLSTISGHAPVTAENAESLGIHLTEAEKELAQDNSYPYGYGTNILVEKALEAGLCPYGNGKARANVWNWYDKIPLHREPLHSVRGDLVDKYPNFPDKPDHFRANIKYRSRQKEKDWVKEFPINMLSGRMVAHMGTGAETRAAKYLAEVEGEMFVEIHPDKAAELGIKNGDMVWLYGTMDTRILVPAKLSLRVDYNSVWLPQNFSGMDQGKSRLDLYPEGTAPYAIGESASMVSSYGFDYNTACPESKCGLCRIEKA